ncbi:MAG: vWA domain-containing protein, partial [Oscillospiraceae bacterium]
MKNLKRFLCTLLVVSMVFAVLPTSVFATNTNIVEPSQSSHIAKPAEGFVAADYPAYPNEGYVKMEKSAAWKDDNKMDAEVTLTIDGKGINTGVDAVLVIDRSNSMKESVVVGTTNVPCTGTYKENWYLEWLTVKYYYECNKCGHETVKANKDKPCTQIFHNDIKKTRLALEKEAANTFVNTMFNSETSTNRVGLVSFCGTATKNKEISDVTQKANITTKINGINCGDGTNYVDPLKEAKKMIDARKDKSRPAYVIFLTDGEPNRPSSNSTGGPEAKALKDVGVIIYSVAFDIDNNDAIKILKDKISSSPSSTYFHNVKD